MAVLAAIQVVFAPASRAEQPIPLQTPVRVRTVAGLSDANLISFSLVDGLRIEVDDEPRLIPAADLISLTRTDYRPIAAARSTQETVGRDGVELEMVGGDRVVGRLTQGPQDAVSIESEDWGKLVVPMERIAGIQFPTSDSPGYSESLRWFQRESKSPDDRVLLTNGDVVTGFIVGVDRDGIRLESGNDANGVPLRLAVAARLVHAAAEPVPGLHAVVTLKDGQQLTVVNLDWQGGKVKAMSAKGEPVEPPAEHIRSLEIRGGLWTWLSQIPATFEEHQPMLTFERKHRTGANVLGTPLRVGGERFEHGVGVHSRSVLAYDLTDGYEEFVTSFGMDDESGRLADVHATVLVDGIPRFEKSNVVTGTLHGPVRVDVSGAKRLELVVDYGLNGDMQDRFDWIEPGLIRAARTQSPP